jgi:hypothetical protein
MFFGGSMPSSEFRMLIEDDLLQASYPISGRLELLPISLTRRSLKLKYTIQQGDQKLLEIRG